MFILTQICSNLDMFKFVLLKYRFCIVRPVILQYTKKNYEATPTKRNVFSTKHLHSYLRKLFLNHFSLSCVCFFLIICMLRLTS